MKGGHGPFAFQQFAQDHQARPARHRLEQLLGGAGVLFQLI